MAQNVDFVAGDIAPAYFEMKLQTKEDLTQLDKLPANVQRAYYHEFIHYIQYNTTGFGLYYFWHIYDRLRDLLGSLPRNEDHVEIPLNNAVAEGVKERNKLFTDLRGSGRLIKIPDTWRKDYKINGVELQQDDFLDAHFPDHKVGHIILKLQHPSGASKLYRFGETCVMEAMTRLAEFRHYGEDELLNEHPYITAEELARFEYAHIADGPELLFALCDVSLMHPLPGWAFYNLLKEMKPTSRTFTCGEDVYNFGLTYFAKQQWRIPYREQNAMDGIVKSLENLFHLPQYQETKAWVSTVLEEGHDLRDNDPYFFIKLFRDKPFTGTMNTVWRRMGGPHCINESFERRIQIPEVLLRQDPDYAQRVFPQRLRMIWQFHELLLNGHAACQQIDVCRTSVPNPGVDQTCDTQPWTRAWIDPWCSYAAAMHQWGLIPRRLVINGIPVDTSMAGRPVAAISAPNPQTGAAPDLGIARDAGGVEGK